LQPIDFKQVVDPSARFYRGTWLSISGFALKRMQVLTGNGRYVFPSLLTGERPTSDNTINSALRRMRFDNTEMTAHGFRATARTIMVEELHIDPEVIEEQLAHGAKCLSIRNSDGGKSAIGITSLAPCRPIVVPVHSTPKWRTGDSR
jgi:hypothetical protein